MSAMDDSPADVPVERAEKLAVALNKEASLLRQDSRRVQSVSAIKVYYWELQQVAYGLREKAKLARTSLSQTELTVENLRVQKELLSSELDVERQRIQETLEAIFKGVGLKLPSDETDQGETSEHASHTAVREMIAEEEQARNRMLEELRVRKREREELETQLRNAKRAFESLPRDIGKLNEAAVAVHQTCRVLGTTLQESTPDYLKLRNLPIPLYVIGQDLLAYQGAVGGISVDVQHSPAPPKVEPKSSVDYHKCDGSSVVMKFSAGESTTSIAFAYMPLLEIVGVSVRTQLRPGVNAFNDTAAFLSLFPGDDGLLSPNPANGHLLNGTFSYSAAHTSPITGLRPFVWANLLGGLEYPPRVKDGSREIPATLLGWYENAVSATRTTRIGVVLEALRRRVDELMAMELQLRQLCKHQLPAEIASPPDKPLRVVRFSESPSAKGSSDRHFLFDFRTSQQSAVALFGSVQVPALYPLVPPTWRLTPNAGVESVGQQDAEIIEAAVNELPGGPAGPAMLLQDQVVVLFSAITSLESQVGNVARDGSHRLIFNQHSRRFD